MTRLTIRFIAVFLAACLVSLIAIIITSVTYEERYLQPRVLEAFVRFSNDLQQHVESQDPRTSDGAIESFGRKAGVNAFEVTQEQASSWLTPSADGTVAEMLMHVGNDRLVLVSADKQSQFVREVFTAWDKHHTRIRFINFIWLHDISQAEVKSYAKYYGLASKGFAEYLGTLGLRTHDGKAKPAFTTLHNEAKARGW